MHFLPLHNFIWRNTIVQFFTVKNESLYIYDNHLYSRTHTDCHNKNAMPQNKICIRLSPNRYKTIAT